MTKTMNLHIDEHLETDQDVQEFLADMAENGTITDFVHALSIVAKAKGMTEIAEKAGVSRASLYKSLSADGNPRYATINKIINALGFRLTVQAIA